MKLIQTNQNYILKNKVIELWMNKDGRADKLIYKGQNLIGSLNGNIIDPDRHHSFYLDYHQDLKSKRPQYNKFKIVENNDQIIHLVWIDDQNDLGLEYHIVLNSEDSKLYSYVIAKNVTNKIFKINELRTVYRLDSKLFPFSKTNARQGLQPSSDYTNQFKKWQDETYEIPDGERFSNSKVYSKYDYADYFSKNKYWGFFGKNLGFWLLPVSKDYYPSGPLKQELMVHYDGILLNYLNSAHFGTSDFAIRPGWSKIYGPWCIYINEAENYPDLFNDVERFSQIEEKKWPYSWVKEDLYPLKRIEVQGQVKTDEHCQMTIVLSQGSENFAKASSGYIYYTNTDENGLFSLKNVRPGKYKLTMFFREGEKVGEFVKENINLLTSNKIVDLGLTDFCELSKLSTQKVLWQIGSASHTSEMFKISNQLRNSIWRKLTPANLHYYIGQSNAHDDWYAIQSNKGKWTIHFKLHLLQGKKYLLKIALAGASKVIANRENNRGHGDPIINVFLNGEAVYHKVLLDDTSIYRNALQSGTYHLCKLDLPTQLLEKENSIAITTNGYLMYDTIELIEEKE